MRTRMRETARRSQRFQGANAPRSGYAASPHHALWVNRISPARSKQVPLPTATMLMTRDSLAGNRTMDEKKKKWMIIPILLTAVGGPYAVTSGGIGKLLSLARP